MLGAECKTAKDRNRETIRVGDSVRLVGVGPLMGPLRNRVATVKFIRRGNRDTGTMVLVDIDNSDNVPIPSRDVERTA